MTINELQKQLKQYNIYILIAFHSYQDILMPIKQYGKYCLVIKSDTMKDSLNSSTLGFISAISNEYILTAYNFKNKKAVQKICSQFTQTSLDKRQYIDYQPIEKGHTSASTGRRKLTSDLKLINNIRKHPQLKLDLEDYGRDKWDILATDNNFNDYYDFKMPKSQKPGRNKVVKLTLSPREQSYLQWLKKHSNPKDNDNNFTGTSTNVLHYLLIQASMIDWKKYSKVMNRAANLQLKENGELADIKHSHFSMKNKSTLNDLNKK